MTERRTRPGRVVGIAEGVAAAVRRRQREREPRVVLFDPDATPRALAPSEAGYDELLEVAARILQIAGEPGDEPRPRSSSRRPSGSSSRAERRSQVGKPAA